MTIMPTAYTEVQARETKHYIERLINLRYIFIFLKNWFSLVQFKMPNSIGIDIKALTVVYSNMAAFDH